MCNVFALFGLPRFLNLDYSYCQFILRMNFAVNLKHSTDECKCNHVFQLKEENEKLRKDLKASNQAREEDKIR